MLQSNPNFLFRDKPIKCCNISNPTFLFRDKPKFGGRGVQKQACM